MVNRAVSIMSAYDFVYESQWPRNMESILQNITYEVAQLGPTRLQTEQTSKHEDASCCDPSEEEAEASDARCHCSALPEKNDLERAAMMQRAVESLFELQKCIMHLWLADIKEIRAQRSRQLPL